MTVSHLVEKTMGDEIMTEDGNDSFHFFEDDDIVVKGKNFQLKKPSNQFYSVSQAIFEDCHSLVTTGLSFDEVIKSLYDVSCR